MKILLFGATGFIGANIHQLLATTKQHTAFAPKLSECNLLHARAVNELVSDMQPEIIINAAFNGVNSKLEYTDTYLFENTSIVTNILHGAQYSKRLKKVIHFGSSLEYGDSDGPISEVNLLDPKNTYATIKAMHTLLVRTLGHNLGVPTVILRPFNLYGEFDRKSVIFYVINSILQKKAVKVTRGEQVRDYLYAGDLLKIFAQILREVDTLPDGEIFNICSGKPIKLADLFKTTFALMKYSYGQEYLPNPTTEYWHQVGDPAKLKKFINYPQLTHLKSGLQNTIDWIRRSNA